jgi:hypothetical protein
VQLHQAASREPQPGRASLRAWASLPKSGSSGAHPDKLPNDYCVIHDGRCIGRIRLADDRSWQGTVWVWNINPPLPVPSWGNGSADSLEVAKVPIQGRLGALLCDPDSAKFMVPHEDDLALLEPALTEAGRSAI